MSREDAGIEATISYIGIFLLIPVASSKSLSILILCVAPLDRFR